MLQCPVGLLISVDSTWRNKTTTTTATTGCIISDLLVYGVLSSAASFERPPTPPGSSSSDFQENVSFAVKRELRIYATPLSESLIAKAQALPSPPRTPSDTHNTGDAAEFAEFLPYLRSPSPKRKRVATLFEVAAQHHKRVRQKGGEAVSQLMANALSQSQSSQQLHTLKIKRESEEPGIALERITSQRGRSVSLGANSNFGKPLDPHTEHSRPSSNCGQMRIAAFRRGTPNPFLEPSMRKEPSPALSSSEEKAKSPSSTPKDAETIISENKHLITRTILTCMRLYGYHRTTSRSVSMNKSVTATAVPAGLDEVTSTSASGMDEDEFKTMYHATYRASTFALRRYLKEPSLAEGMSSPLPPLLEKEKATALIDEFLRLFCEES